MGQGSSSSPQTPAVTLNKDVPTTTRRRTIFQSVREDEFAPRRSRSMTLPIKLFEKQRKELVRTQSDLGAEATKETNVVVLSEDDDGNKMINNYTVLRPIGKGSYGKVKLCIDSNNKAFAVKIMEKSALKRVKKGESSALDDVMREIAILKKIRHENIVRLYEIINDPANDRLYLVMEFVENGSLKTDKPLPIEKCNKYMHDLIRGLEYRKSNP
jgi:serine/threonine protein kinase